MLLRMSEVCACAWVSFLAPTPLWSSWCNCNLPCVGGAYLMCGFIQGYRLVALLFVYSCGKFPR